MLNDITVDELTRVISLATAPAFLLGAVASLLSLLVARLNTTMDRSRKLHAIDKNDPKRSHLRSDIPRTMRRARAMQIGVGLGAASGITTGWMVVVIFVDALFGLQNSRAIVIMFVGAMTLFTTALFCLLYEVIASSGGFAHFEG